MVAQIYIFTIGLQLIELFIIYIYSKVRITLPGTNSLKVLVSDGAIC